MIRKIIAFVLFFLGIFIAGNVLGNGIDLNNPKSILKKVKDEVNSDEAVQDTELDDVQGDGIQDTLDSLRTQIEPYLQWAVAAGLAIAIIAIIYNALIMVTGSIQESQIGKVKTRLMWLSLGVVVLGGFYFIIEIVISVVATITN